MTVSYRYTMRFPGTREQISQACLEAVRQSGFKIRESDLAAGQISARARVNSRSWGENIHVYLDTEDGVDITSECRFSPHRRRLGQEPLERQADLHPPGVAARRRHIAAEQSGRH